MTKRHTTEFVNSVFEKHGAILLSEYLGCQQTLEFKCKCGNLSQVTFAVIQRGYITQCMECRRQIKIKNPSRSRHSQEFVELEFKKYGATLLTKYLMTRQRLEFICKCGNEHYCTLANVLRRGQIPRCLECSKREKLRGPEHPQWNHDLSEDDRHLINTGRGELHRRWSNQIARAVLIKWRSSSDKS